MKQFHCSDIRHFHYLTLKWLPFTSRTVKLMTQMLLESLDVKILPDSLESIHLWIWMLNCVIVVHLAEVVFVAFPLC